MSGSSLGASSLSSRSSRGKHSRVAWINPFTRAGPNLGAQGDGRAKVDERLLPFNRDPLGPPALRIAAVGASTAPTFMAFRCSRRSRLQSEALAPCAMQLEPAGEFVEPGPRNVRQFPWPLTPHRFCYLDNAAELGFFIGDRKRIAQEVAAEAALWRQADLIKRDVFLSVLDPFFQALRRF